MVKKIIIMIVIVLILILGGILYSMQKELYTPSVPETVESTTSSLTTSTPPPSPTKTSPTTPTTYPQREEVKVPLKIIRYDFISDKGFEKILNITSTIAYYYLTIKGIAVTGENPKLTVGLKVVTPEKSYTGLFHEVSLVDVKPPYVVEGKDWVYVTEGCKAKYIITVEIYNAEVQGELTIILQKPIELNYSKEYLIKGNYGILLFKLRNNENNLILLRKKPTGGEIRVIQPLSNCLISGFAPNWWEPTGIVAELSSVAIPSYMVAWGGHTVNGKMVKGGWMEKTFSSNGLFIIIRSKEKEYELVLSEANNIGSPRSAPILKIGDKLNLPIASHVEGVVFNVSVENAPAAITLELEVKTKEKVPSELWIGANLINSSGIVVSTTPAVIIPGKAKSILIYLVATGNGMHTVWLSYNTGSITEIGFKVELLSIKPANLSVFEYEEEWGVWKGKIEYK